MRHFYTIMLFCILIVSCKYTDKANQDIIENKENRTLNYEQITGLVINNNEYSIKEITDKFPNLKLISFTNCNMAEYDFSKLNIYIHEIVVGDDCYGELVCSSPNYMIEVIRFNEANITHIRHGFLLNLPKIQKISSFNTALLEIDFPENETIISLSIFNALIEDFSSLANLKNLEDVNIRQYNLLSEYDVSSITKLKSLKSLCLSSNFHIDSNQMHSLLQEMCIVSVENHSLKGKMQIFSSLENLSINSYYDSEFPVYLSSLPKLKVLGLYNTEISEFPRDLSSFEALQKLDFVYNKVERFPPDIIFPPTFEGLYLNNDSFDFETYRRNYPAVKFEILEI